MIKFCCGNYAASERGNRMNLSLWRTKKGALFWKAQGIVIARLRAGPDGQSLGRSSNDHLRYRRMAVNWSNIV